MVLVLESVLGGSRSLDDYLGKPALIVAESLTQRGMNPEFERRLHVFIQANVGLLDRIHLVPVAIMPPIPKNNDIARSFARAGLRMHLERSGLRDLLIDWDESVYAGMGWSEAAKGQPVYALLDARGTVQWGHYGVVAIAAIDVLERLVMCLAAD